MKTQIVKIDSIKIDSSSALERAGEIISGGGLVAFPTETVYGLGANALDANAAKKIYQAKGRPSDNPLIIHIAEEKSLSKLVQTVSPTAKALIRKFWPGPLTLIFKKTEIVPMTITGGLNTVAIRMPDHVAARSLIMRAGVPIAAPSANTSGRPSPTLAEHVLTDLDGKIEMILDGGMVGIGLESTIVDVSEGVPVLLRPGAVTVEMLKEITGELEIDPAISEPMKAELKPKAPGMKYKHYAPQAELCLFEGGKEVVISEICKRANELESQGLKVGIICTDESRTEYQLGIVKSIGKRNEPESIALHLFEILREFDDLGVAFILSESFSQEALGLAIMNRLMKAAGYHIIKV